MLRVISFGYETMIVCTHTFSSLIFDDASFVKTEVILKNCQALPEYFPKTLTHLVRVDSPSLSCHPTKFDSDLHLSSSCSHPDFPSASLVALA